MLCLHVCLKLLVLLPPPSYPTRHSFPHPSARGLLPPQITLGINFFGHAYLTQLLLPALKASAPARLVWVSSTEESIAEPDWSDIR
jgi:hypothetical protein